MSSTSARRSRRASLLLALLFVAIYIYSEREAFAEHASENSFGEFEKNLNLSPPQPTIRETLLLHMSLRQLDSARETYLLVRTKTREDGTPLRSLSFFQENPSGTNTLLSEYKTMDAFLTAFTVGDNSKDIFSVWEAGSAFHLVIFQIKEKSVDLVFSYGTKTPPEILIDSTDGAIVLLLDAIGASRPHYVEVYRQKSFGYGLVGKVKSNKRFSQMEALLARLPASAKM